MIGSKGHILAAPSVVLLTVWATGCSGPSESKTKDPQGQAQPQIISEWMIFSTTGQRGVKTVPGDDQLCHRALEKLTKKHRSGASSIALVRGQDIREAIQATEEFLVGRYGAAEPALPDDFSKAKILWLAAYLGTSGSEPPAWQVVSAERRGRALRLAYRKSEAATSRDRHQYFVWVMLGDLEPGMYSLELYDAEEGQVTFMREVRVPKEEPPAPAEPAKEKEAPRPR